MQKKEIKIIIFLLLTSLSFIFIEKAASLESKTNRWYQFKQLPENSLDIVYLGNSHNMQGVIPQIIEDTLQLKGFTIGVPGESIQTTYFELVEIFKTQSPKYVALETYALDTNLKGEDGHVFAFIDSIPLSLNSFNTTMQIYNPANAYNYFSFIRQHASLWKTPEMLFSLNAQYGRKMNQNNPELDFYLRSDGYYYNDTQITNDKLDYIQDTYDEEASKTSLQLDQETQMYLEKIIQLCNQHQAQLFLFTMPVINDYLNLNYSTLNYSQIATQYHLSYLDLRPEEFNLLHYSDTNHLTELGALRATLIIADHLAAQYHLETNQFNQKEYQQLNIDDYTLEQLNSQSTRLQLHSSHGDLEKNNYSYVTNINGQVKGGHPDKESLAAVIIEYENPGEYRFTMNITNPTINYTIKQNIILNVPIEE